jgi:hypothetical protein
LDFRQDKDFEFPISRDFQHFEKKSSKSFKKVFRRKKSLIFKKVRLGLGVRG